jgi:hypothetical protein
VADTPTARTLRYLREQGYCAEVVERWIPQARKRKDLFGFADIAGLHPAHAGVLLVQCTSGSHHAARRTKLASLATVQLALQAGCQVQIISWTQQRATRRWVARVESVTAAD